MHSIMEKRLPLIIIGSIFISLIIVINFTVSTTHKSPSEKLQLGIITLIEDDYKLYGEISIKGKTEDTLGINDMSLLYSGVINNSSNMMTVDFFITSEIFSMDKRLGQVYKSQDKIIMKPNTDHDGYLYYDISKNNIKEDVSLDKVKNILNLLKDKIVDESKEAIIIKGYDIGQKIMTNKLSIQLKNHDLNMLIGQMVPNEDLQLREKLIKIINSSEFKVAINTYIDNQNHIKKLEIVFENNDYSITSINSFQNYQRVNSITIPDISKDALNFKNMKKQEIMEIIYKLLCINNSYLY